MHQLWQNYVTVKGKLQLKTTYPAQIINWKIKIRSLDKSVHTVKYTEKKVSMNSKYSFLQPTNVKKK